MLISDVFEIGKSDRSCACREWCEWCGGKGEGERCCWSHLFCFEVGGDFHGGGGCGDVWKWRKGGLLEGREEEEKRIWRRGVKERSGGNRSEADSGSGGATMMMTILAMGSMVRFEGGLFELLGCVGVGG